MGQPYKGTVGSNQALSSLPASKQGSTNFPDIKLSAKQSEFFKNVANNVKDKGVEAVQNAAINAVADKLNVRPQVDFIRDINPKNDPATSFFKHPFTVGVTSGSIGALIDTSGLSWDEVNYGKDPSWLTRDAPDSVRKYYEDITDGQGVGYRATKEFLDQFYPHYQKFDPAWRNSSINARNQAEITSKYASFPPDCTLALRFAFWYQLDESGETIAGGNGASPENDGTASSTDYFTGQDNHGPSLTGFLSEGFRSSNLAGVYTQYFPSDHPYNLLILVYFKPKLHGQGQDAFAGTYQIITVFNISGDIAAKTSGVFQLINSVNEGFSIRLQGNYPIAYNNVLRYLFSTFTDAWCVGCLYTPPKPTIWDDNNDYEDNDMPCYALTLIPYLERITNLLALQIEGSLPPIADQVSTDDALKYKGKGLLGLQDEIKTLNNQLNLILSAEGLLAMPEDYGLRPGSDRPLLLLLYKERSGGKWGKSTASTSIFHPNSQIISTLFGETEPSLFGRTQGNWLATVALKDGSLVKVTGTDEQSSKANLLYLLGFVDSTWRLENDSQKIITSHDQRIGTRTLQVRKAEYYANGKKPNVKPDKYRYLPGK